MTRPTGVLVMAYGTPATADDIEAYYTHIRRGRPPSPEQLANLRARYDALGGSSTLAARTADQVAGIAAALDRIDSGNSEAGGYVVTLGQKHAEPFIEDGVAKLAEAGVDRIVGLVLAPHFSAASVGQYHQRASTTAEEAGVTYAAIDRWYDSDAYHRFLVDAVGDGLADLAERADPARTEVVFTAHSLPERVLADDPYAHELEAGASRVAAELELPRAPGPDGVDQRGLDQQGVDQRGASADGPTWSIGWQSAGATPEPWRGPDILEVIREVAASGRADALLVCPHGFVADHLEVAHDLDIEAARVASEAGVTFARTRVLNDDPATLTALAALIASPELGDSPVSSKHEDPQVPARPPSPGTPPELGDSPVSSKRTDPQERSDGRSPGLGQGRGQGPGQGRGYGRSES